MLQLWLIFGHNFSTKPLVGCGKHETNDILLSDVKNPKSPDLEALEMFCNVVRVKRGMSIFRHYEVREGQPNGPEELVIANDFDSEIEHEFALLIFETEINASLIIPLTPEHLNNADENTSLDPNTDYKFSWLDIVLTLWYYKIL